jgi:5-methylcytosine-specific restriction endonuclease McrA
MMPIIKRCSRCREDKPVGAFGKRRASRDGLNSACRVCRACETAECRKANPEKIKARKATFYLNNSEKIKAHVSLYRKTNRAKINARNAAYRLAHPIEKKAKDAAWKKANPGKVSIQWHRRRAIKVGAQGSHTTGEWLALVAAFNNECAYCHHADRPITRDHVVPFVRGGSNNIDNIAPACGTCNSSKGTKTGAEFNVWLCRRAA